jgi:hypothetical protein
MKDSTVMTSKELDALRASVSATLGKLRAEIDGLAERRRKAEAALARAVNDLERVSVSAEDGARLEAELDALREERILELGTAHADGRKPNTTKLDKAINKAETDLAAYREQHETAKAAAPIIAERLATARARHASEVWEINAAMVRIKAESVRLKRRLLEGAMRFASHVALDASADEMVADQFRPAADRSTYHPTAMEMAKLFRGSEFSALERHFTTGGGDRSRRDAEMARLAALGLAANAARPARQVAIEPPARPVQQGPRVIEKEPVDARDRRYAGAGVFTADGQRIS